MVTTIGADPEVFVLDKSDGRIVNAEGMVLGDKTNPEPVLHGAIQVDGMALEINITPATNEGEFKRNITTVMKQLNEYIGLEYDLLPLPSVRFDRVEMDNASMDAKSLGCEPDYNAWLDGEANPTPDEDSNLRTGAGHLHIGWRKDVPILAPNKMCCAAIKQLDACLGIQSRLWDDDMERRTMYGKAGAFRPKTYGVEYRVLSNAWLRSEKLMGHVYNVAVKAIDDLRKGIEYLPGTRVAEIINKGDLEQSRALNEQLFEQYGVPAYVR